QQQHLRADGVGVVVPHLRAEPDDAFPEQSLVDRVVEAEAVALLGASRLLAHVHTLPLVVVWGSGARSQPGAGLSRTLTRAATGFCRHRRGFADGAPGGDATGAVPVGTAPVTGHVSPR